MNNQYNTHSHTDNNNHVILANRSVVKNNSISGGTNSTTLPGHQDSLKGELRKPSLGSIQLETAETQAGPNGAVQNVSLTRCTVM